jgi:hypothetical protein
MTVVLIAMYLAAITAANLTVTEFGPEASIYSAFGLIGFDLICRDRLHDLFSEHRWPKMGALVLAGSALSYLLNDDSRDIAIASAVAFGAAFSVDALIYGALRSRGWPWLERANASNVPASAVDSLIFPTLAFGTFLWPIVFGQFAAKVAGGAVWSLILKNRREVVVEAT